MIRRRFTIGVATPMGMSVPYAYFVPARALGYDQDEGFEFDFFAGGEPGVTARSLCSGSCDVACLNTIVGFMGRANESLPMLAIGSKARRTHRYFAVLRDSPIKTLADLRNKRIACDFPHIQPLAEAAMAEEGVAAGTFEWVPWHGSGMQFMDMIEPARRGEIDAFFIMDWTDGDAAARGIKLRHLPARLLERIRVSSCYWATDAAVTARPDDFARALRAIQRSLTFSFENPKAALRMMWDLYPDTRSDNVRPERNLVHDLEVLKACLEPMRIDARDADTRWCAIPADEMEAWHDTLLRSGSIVRPIDVERLYTNALVDFINDFDAGQSHAAARAVNT